jgi:ArsR family transcriptional regulator
MATTKTPIFDHMSALADVTRSRLLLVLDRHELSVSELCTVLHLPQSTVSRHLKILGDEGLVVSRADGTSRQYRMVAKLEPSVKRLWQVVREQLADTPATAQDAQRVRGVIAGRKSKSQEFFSTAAGQWDSMRAELFGNRTDLLALLALLDPSWTVGDLGSGTGHISASLAPFVRRVIAVDNSKAMLNAAKRRLEGVDNVELRSGTLEELPVKNAELDAAVCFLVLHYITEPFIALEEAFRALRPAGRLLVVDMMPHARDDFRERMGHVWQGFPAERMSSWMAEAGFDAPRFIPLPADPNAKGPALFVATGVKPH